MELIIASIGTLAWWFNIIIASLVGILISKIIKNSPSWFTSKKRKWKFERLVIIKAIRRDPCAINYEISRSIAKFIVFILFCLFFITWLTYRPIQLIFEFNFLVGMAFTAPIYIAEVIWLKQDILVKEAITYRAKLRITRALNGTKTVG